MSGTRPSPFVQFIHDRGVRLAAGLAVVVAIPMAVLFYFQFKSLNDIETTSAVVLRQLSSETADSLTRSIEDYLKRPHISVLLRIPQRQTEPLDLPFIEPILNDALTESPFVESFFVWTEVGPQANKWLVFDQASKTLPSGDVRAVPRRQGASAHKLLRAAARAGQDAAAPSSPSPRRSTAGRTTCRRSCASKARRASA